jgi:transcriptional regulator with XRE-family HTH domain
VFDDLRASRGDGNLSFGRRLREARDRLRLTQQQFAELGGVKRVSQHLYEQDAGVPDPEVSPRFHACSTI